MKLWLDDKRPAPEGFIHHRTSEEMIRFMRKVAHFDTVLGIPSTFDEISLDHDLGGDDTGMRVLQHMIDTKTWPKVLTIHTDNPPARENLLRAANAEAPDWVDIYFIYR